MSIYNNRNSNKHNILLYRIFIKNSKVLMVCIVICSITVLSWYYWNSNFNVFIEKENNQYSTDDKCNNYSVLTSMMIARQLADQGKFSAAEKQLQEALNQTSEDNLQSIIILRIARLQLQQRKFDIALKNLDKIKNPGWSALAEDIRGDAQLVRGDQKSARIAYKKALHLCISPPLKALLLMKLNNISN